MEKNTKEKKKRQKLTDYSKIKNFNEDQKAAILQRLL